MLPERRKSAEEIARLRESLGVPGSGVEAGRASEPMEPTLSENLEVTREEKSPLVANLKEGPAEIPGEGSLVEKSPLFPEDDADLFLRGVDVSAAAEDVVVSLGSDKKEKVVRSLKRSERVVPVVRLGATDVGAKSPVRKIPAVGGKLREDPTFLPEANVARLEKLSAKWWEIGGGYFLTVMGAVMAWLGHFLPKVPGPDLPFEWLASWSRAESFTWRMVMAALVVEVTVLLGAGVMAKLRLRSRHHASLLTILAIVVIVFSLSSILSPTYGT